MHLSTLWASASHCCFISVKKCVDKIPVACCLFYCLCFCSHITTVLPRTIHDVSLNFLLVVIEFKACICLETIFLVDFCSWYKILKVPFHSSTHRHLVFAIPFIVSILPFLYSRLVLYCVFLVENYLTTSTQVCC